MTCQCCVQVRAGGLPLPHRLLQEQPAEDGQAVGGEGVQEPVPPQGGRHPLPAARPPAHARPGHGVCGVSGSRGAPPEGAVLPALR